MTYSDGDIESALRAGHSGSQLGGFPNWIRIGPFDAAKQIQPASVDLRLGGEFALFPDRVQEVDLIGRHVEMDAIAVPVGGYHPLEPGGFALATTVEHIELGPGIVGRVEGKSSLGRIGLAVHVTAGFIDPGFRGQVTLELFNASPNVIRLRPDVFICQMSFHECNTESKRPYGSPGLGSRYQGQKGVQPAKS